jgi:hypothetical protein
LNKSVMFLEDTKVLVTSDAWRVAIELDTQVYEDAIATVRNNLPSVQRERNSHRSQN